MRAKLKNMAIGLVGLGLLAGCGDALDSAQSDPQLLPALPELPHLRLTTYSGSDEPSFSATVPGAEKPPSHVSQIMQK